ncbi:SDR family oxidoreductase [Neobacillus sp. FSL H8-0543]|uniref:SDR family NAD(P)-dependent oxidoreductase n=1 Tax=Neobacillus sp. FSL H8-0543 TaxID=2954672 RepID=UPI00315987B1
MSIFSNEALKNKHIIITGASGGIGRATVEVIASMGAKITASGRNTEKLKKLIEDYPGYDIAIVEADINKPQDRQALVDIAIKTHGPIFGLVNSAGTAGGGFGRQEVEHVDEELLTNVMHTNWTATVLLTQLVYKEMIKQKDGAIVNISSLSGLRGRYGASAYVSSKFALIGFTQSLALEAIEHRIRVNAVCPGYVETEMGQSAILSSSQRNGLSYEEQLEKIKTDIPSSEIINPIEVANTVAFLLTNATNNIIGESIKISGGAVL